MKPHYPTWLDKEYEHFSPDAKEKIAMAAMRTEALINSGMGETIRGGTQFSLNNETLAAGIETAAGVIAKKLVEKETFCYFKAQS